MPDFFLFMEFKTPLSRAIDKEEKKKCMPMMPFYEYVFLEYSLMAEL